MNRAEFMAGLRAGTVKLSPYTPPGFDEPIYLKPLTLADIKAQLTKPEESKDVRERLANDKFYIERALARIVHNEDGVLLFDEKDDAQMAELAALLDANPHNVSRLIHDAHDALQQPSKTEADAKGN